MQKFQLLSACRHCSLLSYSRIRKLSRLASPHGITGFQDISTHTTKLGEAVLPHRALHVLPHRTLHVLPHRALHVLPHRTLHVMCSKFKRYSGNESCYVRSRFSSGPTDSSLTNSRVSESLSFDITAEEENVRPAKYDSLNEESSSCMNTPVSRFETSSASRRGSKAPSRNTIFDTSNSVDQAFIKDLLDEYEAQKSFLFKETHKFSSDTLTDTHRVPSETLHSGALHDSEEVTFGTLTPSAADTEAKRPEEAPNAAEDDDVFGDVSGVVLGAPEYEQDEKDEARLRVAAPRYPKPHQDAYAVKLDALCKGGKLGEAIKMLEEEMRELKIPPTRYHYRILIGACAKLGLADKAFELFYQLRKRGLAAKPLLYSYLFIACANDKDPTLHRQRITDLRAKMAVLQVPISQMVYNAMLIAFGRCGAVETAFEVFDEMLSVPSSTMTTRSFNCLMNACISDREAGFRYAIVLWQKLHKNRLKPNIYSFNLLLRCASGCKAGDPVLLLKLLRKMSASNPLAVNPGHISSGLLKLGHSGSPTLLPRKFDVIDVMVSERDATSNKKNRNLSEYEEHQPVSNAPECKKRETSKTKASYFDNFSNFSNFSHEDKSSLDFDALRMNTTRSKEGKSSVTKVDNDPFALGVLEEGEVVQNEEIIPSNSSTGAFGSEVMKKACGIYLVEAQSQMDPVTGVFDADTPSGRLQLLGGLSAILNSMAALKIKPNMSTFLSLLWALPDTLLSEEELLRAMKDTNVIPNTTFCNMLIKKRGLRGDYELAKATLSLLTQHRLQPDVITFGCLALGCRSLKDAKQLVRTITEHGSRPNIIIMLNLAKNAVSARQYDYAIWLLEQLRKHNVMHNALFIEVMEDARTQALAGLKELDNDQSGSARKEAQRMKLFLQRYRIWLQSSRCPKERIEVKQYKRPDVASQLL